MGVGSETCAFLDAVFVDDAQGAKGLEGGVEVGGEGEGVEGVEPAVVCEAALGGGAEGYFERA